MLNLMLSSNFNRKGKSKMKRFNSSKKRLVLSGFVMAFILAGARITKADYTFGEPVNLGPMINSSTSDLCTDVSPDGLSLFFVSARSGGYGGELGDLWMTRRPAMSESWGQPVNLGPIVNGSSSENGPCLSADGSVLYYSSDRPGGVKAGALQLDGIDDYVNAEFVQDPVDGPFSIFDWINSSVPGGVVLSQVDGIDGSGETWLGTESSEGKLMAGLIPPQAGRIAPLPLISESVVTDGQWHNVGFVWDGSYRSLYVDGSEVAKDTAAQNPLQSATGGLYVGTGKKLEAGNFFSGLIDDVRIYNVALTADNIEAFAR